MRRKEIKETLIIFVKEEKLKASRIQQYEMAAALRDIENKLFNGDLDKDIIQIEKEIIAVHRQNQISSIFDEDIVAYLKLEETINYKNIFKSYQNLIDKYESKNRRKNRRKNNRT